MSSDDQSQEKGISGKKKSRIFRRAGKRQCLGCGAFPCPVPFSHGSCEPASRGCLECRPVTAALVVSCEAQCRVTSWPSCFPRPCCTDPDPAHQSHPREAGTQVPSAAPPPLAQPADASAPSSAPSSQCSARPPPGPSSDLDAGAHLGFHTALTCLWRFRTCPRTLTPHSLTSASLTTLQSLSEP